ncbi:MAG: type II toxin-antitoxin system VapC family toxin [Opitutales bacterium]
MNYCLDTNIVSYFLAGQSLALKRRFGQVAPQAVLLPEIVCAELLYGIVKSQRKAANLSRLESFLAGCERVAFSSEYSAHYASIRVALEKKGTPIGPRDLLIAATARAHDATVVTANVKEFKRVPALRVEDWTKA